MPSRTFGVNFLCGYFGKNLICIRFDDRQLVRATMDFGDGLQNGICVLREHGIKLADSFLPAEGFNGAQIGIQLINYPGDGL